MKTAKILYLDNRGEASVILNNLLDSGYDVRLVHLIYDAKTQILSEDYDLFISEIDIDDGDGLEFIQDIKQKYSIKSIIVSQNRESQRLLRAIDIGIDKYLLKPIDLEELKLAISNLLDDSENTQDSTEKRVLKLAQDFSYDIDLNILQNPKGEVVVMTKQESSLVKTLIENKNSYCSHYTLQNAMGVSSGATTIDTLRTVVRKIRKKTYEDIISNLSGVGYKIDVEFPKRKENISSLITIEEINKRVLIIKGNEKQSNILKMKLEDYGLECEQVFLLEEAKEALRYQSFDYLIIDLQLPDGDGVELVRAEKGTQLNKIIILSNSEDMHYKEYLYFKGIIDYIEKREDLDYLAFSIYKTILRVESNHIYNNILVIESSKKIKEQIKDILLPRNYHIDTLHSPSKVLDLLKHKSYNLIILDLELEGTDSLEFLISLKKEVGRVFPVIVLSSTHRSYTLVRECYDRGAVECLRKPLFAEEFILKIDQWTEYYKQTLEITNKQRLLSQYQSIVDNTVIVSKTDTKGIITYANPIFCAISGYSKDELIGKTHSIIRHPDTKDEIFKSMWHTISQQKSIWHGVIKNRKKDGSSYVVSTYIMPILDYNDEVIEYIALRNDISDIEKNKN